MGQWHPIRLWHYFGPFRRFDARKLRKQAAITKTRFKFGSNASPPVKLRLVVTMIPVSRVSDFLTWCAGGSSRSLKTRGFGLLLGEYATVEIHRSVLC